MTKFQASTLISTALALLTTPGASLSAQLVKEPTCVIAARWAKAHKAELPQTYAEIVQYPLAYRRAIQSNLSANGRKAVWRAQWEMYSRSELLTSAQHAVIGKAISHMDEFYAPSTTVDRRRLIGDSVLAEAEPLFGRILTAKIFMQLGPDDARLSAASARRFGQTPNIQSALFSGATTPVFAAVSAPVRGGLPALFANCECHIGVSEPECGILDCNNWSCQNVTERGCGYGGDYSCNGLCG